MGQMLDTKELTAHILDSLANLDDFFSVTRYTENLSKITKGYAGYSLYRERANYKPLGIVGYDISGTGTSVCYPVKFYLTQKDLGVCEAYIGIRNTSNADLKASDLKIRFDILWVKVVDSREVNK